MAFEVPLEADKVDDLNLFSTLFRAPVISTIVWILGGHKEQEEGEECKAATRLDDDVKLDENDATNIYDHTARSCSSSSSSMKRSLPKQQRSILKKVAPSLVGSDISECDVRESLDAMCLYNENSTKYIPGLKKKELSWSDEVGDDLVVSYEKSTIHEPKPPDEQPVRSALSRSRSIRSDANCLAKSQIENKYLPPQNSYRQNNSLLKHQSIPYPMNHSGVEPFSSGTGGYDSPQWGWYINTTPPSPDMYFTSRPTKSMRVSGVSMSETSDTSIESASMATPATLGTGNAHPNPVFQCLQDKHKAAPMGWPSVPL